MDETTKESVFEALKVPVSFKVIGIGAEAEAIIEKVKAFGYDGVDYIMANSRDSCSPTNDDKMAIIVAPDNEDVANAIAKKYHDAGILTIGFLRNQIASCYDSVALDAPINEFSNIIKALLQPLVAPGFINYSFDNLDMTLRDSGFFKTLNVHGENIENTVVQIKKSLDVDNLTKVEFLSAHIYFHHEKRTEIKMEDMARFCDMLSNLPNSVNTIWSLNFDNSMPTDRFRISAILSGKELK